MTNKTIESLNKNTFSVVLLYVNYKSVIWEVGKSSKMVKLGEVLFSELSVDLVLPLGLPPCLICGPVCTCWTRESTLCPVPLLVNLLFVCTKLLYMPSTRFFLSCLVVSPFVAMLSWVVQRNVVEATEGRWDFTTGFVVIQCACTSANVEFTRPNWVRSCYMGMAIWQSNFWEVAEGQNKLMMIDWHSHCHL